MPKTTELQHLFIWQEVSINKIQVQYFFDTCMPQGLFTAANLFSFNSLRPLDKTTKDKLNVQDLTQNEAKYSRTSMKT